MVYKNEEGLYKYLQTISAYLVIPVFPAILVWNNQQKGHTEGSNCFGFYRNNYCDNFRN